MSKMVHLNLNIIEQRQYIKLAFHLLLLFLIFCTHKCAILFTHFKVLDSLNQRSTKTIPTYEALAVDGIPAYVTACGIIVFFIILSGMSCAGPKWTRTQKYFILFSSLFFIVFSSLGTLLQLGVVIVKDVLLFLETEAESIAKCFCVNPNVTIANRNNMSWCRCNVPGEPYPTGFSIMDPQDNLDVEFLNTFLDQKSYKGNEIKIVYHASEEDVLQHTKSEFGDIKLMLAMVYLSVIFIVIRSPMFWVIKEAMKKDIQSTCNTIEQDQNQHFSPGITESSRTFVGVTLALVESLDAFSLLDDIIEHRYIFSGDMTLTIVTLTFALNTTVLINVATIIVFFPGETTVTAIPFRAYINHIKMQPRGGQNLQNEPVPIVHTPSAAGTIMIFLVRSLCNMPLLALRSYLIYAYGGFMSTRTNGVHVLFIAKEIILSVLGLTDFLKQLKKINKDTDEHEPRMEITIEQSNQLKNVQDYRERTVQAYVNNVLEDMNQEFLSTNL